jgi:hypothetical protein
MSKETDEAYNKLKKIATTPIEVQIFIYFASIFHMFNKCAFVPSYLYLPSSNRSTIITYPTILTTTYSNIQQATLFLLQAEVSKILSPGDMLHHVRGTLTHLCLLSPMLAVFQLCHPKEGITVQSAQ